MLQLKVGEQIKVWDTIHNQWLEAKVEKKIGTEAEIAVFGFRPEHNRQGGILARMWTVRLDSSEALNRIRKKARRFEEQNE